MAVEIEKQREPSKDEKKQKVMVSRLQFFLFEAIEQIGKEEDEDDQIK